MAFVIQLVGGAGAGSWVTGLTTVICFFIFVLALIKGNRQFVWIDWISLISALVAMALWRISNNPTASVLLITITDALGFVPTYRKGYYQPLEETASQYALAALKWAFGLIALETFSFVTWFVPVSLILLNGGFFLLLLVRRKISANTPLPSKAGP
ncbi:MAG: hypothetical protein HYY50_02980 [Candidatus Kerfeldbacteria bacterium]|nr:hypothetical protein [Candidatus Kerfeldbacteria bacterium]